MLPVQYSYLGKGLCRYARHVNPAATIVRVPPHLSNSFMRRQAEAKTIHQTHPRGRQKGLTLTLTKQALRLLLP
jgi:hypothetical protein